MSACAMTVGTQAMRIKTRAHFMQMVLCGVTGIWGLQLFYTLGLWKTTSEKTAVFQLLTPILVAILAACIGAAKYEFRCSRGNTWQVQRSS